jgi:hypothetical protein
MKQAAVFGVYDQPSRLRLGRQAAIISPIKAPED